MPSRSLLSVQEKLERRWKYVCEADLSGLGQAMASYHEFVTSNTALSVAAQRLLIEYPNVEDWAEGAVSDNREWRSGLAGSHHESAARAWAVMAIAVRHHLIWRHPEIVLRNIWFDSGRDNTRGSKQTNDWIRDIIARSFLRPLHEYLLDALDANVETLAAIRWFQQWAQWFGASRFEWEKHLENRAVESGSKTNHEYEKRFQPVLFEKLFEYGLRLDIELNREPSTASGEPDFVVTQHTSAGPRAIPVEAKIVDRRCDSSTRFGFRQLRRYMDERHADAGYLVLFDTTPHGHQIDLADAPDGVPMIPLADQRRVYVVYVPTRQQLSASLDRKASPARPGLTRAHFDEHAD